jgi:hypothetical protein
LANVAVRRLPWLARERRLVLGLFRAAVIAAGGRDVCCGVGVAGGGWG